ncbi:MAG: hypothetical protein NTZ33_13095 [Bacteroidetes bacterium]|nr:hypothetical protein [Bacteroidota bacterium]
MNTKRKINWGVVVILSMLLLLITYNIYRQKQLKSNYKFTVAKVIKIKAAADGGSQSAIFTYYVNDKYYEGFVPIYNDTRIRIGNKFYIKFYSNNPNNSELTEIPFLDTLTVIPTSGWNEIPNSNIKK